MAQLVERSPSTQNVAGSNPAQGSSFFLSRKKGVVFGRSCLLCLVSLNEFTCTFIPGLSWDGLCIPGIPGYSDKGHTARRATLHHVHSSRDYPGMICVSLDTQTKAWYMVVLDWASHIHPRIIRDHILFILAV